MNINYINERIFNARGNLKIDEGNGYELATVEQWARVACGLERNVYKIVGYSERSIGKNIKEINLAIRRNYTVNY